MGRKRYFNGGLDAPNDRRELTWKHFVEIAFGLIVKKRWERVCQRDLLPVVVCRLKAEQQQMERCRWDTRHLMKT